LTSRPDKSLKEQDLQIESDLFSEIIHFYPERLSIEEWVTRMTDEGNDAMRVSVEDAVVSLARSGLVRRIGVVIEPTLAARRASQLFLG
jgi:hypothetical protein